MAASVKFDSTSNSPEGASYMNSQRGSYAASLDRSGSFREGSECRIPPSVASSSRSLTQADAISLTQALLPDLKLVVIDQKYPRQGDLKKVFASVIGASQDDSSSHNFNARAAPGLSPEEFKRAKSTLHDCIVKARERAKYYGDLASKYDRYLLSNSTKKRARSDMTSMERSSSLLSGAGTAKTGSQVHPASGASDPNSQRSDERSKAGVPNRRIRTSMMVDARMEQRPTNLKPCNALGSRDKDTLKSGSGSAEEKSSGVGWDSTRMKKKRTSVKPDMSDQNIVMARTPSVDRESKQGLQQRLGNDAQQRIGTNLGFRPNAREESSVCPPAAANRSSTSARAPRSNGVPPSRASPCVHRMSGSPEESEIQPFTNKSNSGIASGNRKRSAPTQSSSPPVTQWGGQRHHKMSRSARRTNFPLVSSHDDNPFSDMETCIRTNDGVEIPRHLSVPSGQMKPTGEHAYSTGLSESEESALIENKSKEKVKKCAELEKNAGPTLQRAAIISFPPRKNKTSGDGEDELGDGTRRLARHGRPLPLHRPAVPSTTEKLENAGSAQQPRNVKFDADRVECKPGRPTTKKFQERKGYPRPRYEAAELHGETEDDHEELLTAANHALSTRVACPNLFWKRMEPFFGLISTDDVSFLKKQSDPSCCSIPEGQVKGAREDCVVTANGIGISKCDGMPGLSMESEQANKPDDCVPPTEIHSRISLCQLLLSAMIDEGEESEAYCYKSRGEECFSDDTCSMQFTNDFSNNANDLDHLPIENRQRVRGYSNGYCLNSSFRYYDEPNNHNMENYDVGPEYTQMCIDDRIFLELNEIGLSPEPMPDLAQSEDEEISEAIRRLEEKLHEEVVSKKSMLSKLEGAVMEAKVSQQRELEQIALDKLVGIAHGKYMAAFHGSGSSASKNTNKISKIRAMSFVKRTLGRCQSFEQTGKSCFSESPFKEMFQSISSSMNEAEGEDAVNGHSSLPSQPVVKNNKLEKLLDTSAIHNTENSSGKDELWSNKMKKREYLLNDGVGNLVSGTKGKRSERDRDGKRSNRDAMTRNGSSRVGRPALSNAKGDNRKNKTKPKHKTTPLSASLSDLLGSDSMPSDPKTLENASDLNAKQKDGSSMPPTTSGPQDINDHGLDLSHLQLPGMDVLGVPDDFGSQPQDFSAWLNIEDDVLQDQDLVGLEIPMDDLSDLNMVL